MRGALLGITAACPALTLPTASPRVPSLSRFKARERGKENLANREVAEAFLGG